MGRYMDREKTICLKIRLLSSFVHFTLLNPEVGHIVALDRAMPPKSPGDYTGGTGLWVLFVRDIDVCLGGQLNPSAHHDIVLGIFDTHFRFSCLDWFMM